MMQIFCLQRRTAALLCLLAIFTLGLLKPAHAQTAGAGTISGTVTDARHAVVSGGSVTVANTDTGVLHMYATNSEGIYVAPFLQPGHYKVAATASGFGKVEASGLTLLVGQTLTIDLTLAVQSATATVEVSASTPVLDPERTEVSQDVDQELVQNLPVNARNWSTFVLVTPNVAQDGGSGLISFHGISGLYNQNYVDGANNNQMLFSEARGRSSGAPYVYSLDSIKEFQAETSNYSVEFGQAAGGQVNAITKSGTNDLHGDLFYYLRYPSLNALDPLSKFQALHNNQNPFLLTQPIHQQQQFGGSAGGSIKRDKLFYFFTYDGFRKVGRVLYSDSNNISLTPAGTYDPTVKANSSLVTPNQCPIVTNTSYQSYLTANKLPAYYITADQCNQGITFLMKMANIAPGQEPPSRYAKQNLFFPRLDYHINDKNDAFVDFNFANFDSTNGYSAAPTFNNSSPSTNGPTSYHERFLVGGLTTVLSNTAVNQVHMQWGRDLETAGANAPGPSVATGVVTFGMPNALPRIAEPDEHRIQATDVFSKTHGRHNLKFGGDANLVHEVMINLYQGGGVYGYGESTPVGNFEDWAFDAFQGQPGDTDPYAGYHYSSFVQTVDVVNTKTGTQGKDDFWMKMFDGFAEDSWKVNQRFTVTAGARYDVQLTPPPTRTNPNYPPVSTYYSQTIKNVLNRVQPRVGFSWTPYNGTVVRGGYGIFSGLNQGSTYYAMRVENGVVQINYNYKGCLSSVGSVPKATCPTVPNVATSLKYPDVPFPVTGPSISSAPYPTGGTAPSVNGPVVVGPQSFHGLDPNFVPPYAHEAELSVEQALPGKMSLSVGYVGTRGMRLPVFVDANLIGRTPHGLRSYNVLDAAGNVVKQLTVPVYLTTDRANPSLSTYNTGFSVANTWYNSMAVTVRRPFQNGLEVLANFTWAKATDTGQVGGANGTFYGGDIPLDPNNIRLENGPSDTDIRNRFTMSFVYQPRIMMGNRLMKNALDGFKFSGDEIASGGQPIYLNMSGTVYNASYGDDGGIYGGAINSGSGQPVGSTSGGRPPQIGRNSIYGPGFNNVDFRITRDVPIHEKMSMQIVGETFNLLNHTIITGVNNTYSQYASAAATTPACSNNASAPAGSALQGCISPYSGTGLTAFGTMNGTNNTLYGPRQLQVSAKFIF